MDTIYCILDTDANQVKIGYSSISGEYRLRTFKTGNPSRLILLAEIEGNEIKERWLHNILSDYQTTGEWFDASCIGFLLSHLLSDDKLTEDTKGLLEENNRLRQRLTRFSELFVWTALLCMIIMVVFTHGYYLHKSEFLVHSAIPIGIFGAACTYLSAFTSVKRYKLAQDISSGRTLVNNAKKEAAQIWDGQ